MATVACPGCGLPREDSELDARPCPVCAGPAPGTGNSRPAPARKQKPIELDPTDGLPADVSELDGPASPRPARAPRAPKRRQNSGAPVVLVAVVTFALGALCGVGGVLGWQAIDWPKVKKDEPEVAAKPNDETTPPAEPPRPQVPAVAPLPHEPNVPPITIEP